MDRGLGKILSRNLARRIAQGSGGVDYLQNLAYNSETYKYYDKGLYGQTGGVVTCNQVPCAVFQGDDGITISPVSFQEIEELKFTYYTPGGIFYILGYYGDLDPSIRINTSSIVTFYFDSGNDYQLILFNPITDGDKISIINDSGNVTVYKNDVINSNTIVINENEIFNQLYKRDVYGSKVQGGVVELKAGAKSFLYTLQEFSGDKAYDLSGNGNHGTWQGSGARYTRVDNIPNPHQAADIKRVTHDNGTAYLPATVSDAEILAEPSYPNASIELLSGMYKDDGSRLNLHASENDEVVAFGNERVTNGGFDNDSGWIKGGTWTISNGTAKSGTNDSDLIQTGLLTTGKSYLLEFDVKVLSGAPQLLIYIGTGSIDKNITISNTVNEKVSVIATADNSSVDIRKTGSTGEIEIDNVSVKEVITLSDKLRELNAPTAYQAGTDQANYVVNYEAGKVTNSMKLKV